ncbi:MAG: type II secretion system F family protein [Patescibacteria group bacterium]
MPLPLPSYKQKWSRRKVTLLLEKIELYLSAGLSLDRACDVVSQGIAKKDALRIQSLRQDIERGVSLSVSLTEHIGISSTTATLIRHGEMSGQLPRALRTSRILIEKSDDIIQTCISALAYPSLIGLCTAGITLGLLRGVMPQIIPMLNNLHVELPLLTKIVIALSEGIVLYGGYVVLMFMVFAVLGTYLYRRYRGVRSICHRVLTSLPISGKILNSYHVSLFLRSLGSLVDSGLSISYVYPHVARGVSLVPLQDMLSARGDDIERGTALGTILTHSRIADYVPPLVSAGEKSGTLGPSLIRAADILDRDIERSLKRMTSLIEPLMMVCMGCVVGAIALSIMLPIYDISKVLQH